MMEMLKHLTLPDETKTIQKRMSRADVKLKEIEQELQHAQKKIFYIKNRLSHMKNVCEKRKLIDSKEYDNSSIRSSNFVVSSVQESNCSSTIGYETSYDALSIEQNCHEDSRNFYSYMSKTSSTKSIVFNDASLAIFENTFQTEKHIAEDKKPSVTKITTEIFSDKHLNHENNSEEKKSISTDELSSSSHNFDHLNDLEPQEIFKPFPPTPKSDKKSQLILKINATHKETSRQYKTKKVVKMKKNLSHQNLLINKQSQLKKYHKHNRPVITRKQRKLKLKKSTLNHLESKNCVFVNLGSKSRKKFKRRTLMNRKVKNYLLKPNIKGPEIIEIINKHDSTPNVVELYHNTATKNTTSSVESSKHYIESQNEADHQEDLGQNQNSMEFIRNEVVNANSMNLNFMNFPKEKFHQLELKGQFGEAGIQDSFSRKKKIPDEPQTEDHHHRHENCHSRSLRSYCGEFLHTGRNYQQPTISSKLKKVEKCYLATKLNFGNIPFNVGTSINRSYNVGFNVQQTASSLKTKQHQTTDDFQYEPMNKTGKTSNSVIQSFLEPLNINSNKLNTNSITQSNSLNYPDAIKKSDNATIQVVQSNESAEIRKKKSVIQNMKNLSADVKLTESKNSLSSYENFSSSREIENALNKIYDRFNFLNEKHDYLHNQFLKTHDKKIKKELIQVKNELREKKDEIRAIVGLFLEIIALKRQMKLQHNSSLLYITTKCSTHNSTKINSSTTTRPRNSHSLHITEYRQRKTQINKKIPPTAEVFAGLLRNMQSIQHQLTSM